MKISLKGKFGENPALSRNCNCWRRLYATVRARMGRPSEKDAKPGDLPNRSTTKNSRGYEWWILSTSNEIECPSWVYLSFIDTSPSSLHRGWFFSVCRITIFINSPKLFKNSYLRNPNFWKRFKQRRLIKREVRWKSDAVPQL